MNAPFEIPPISIWKLLAARVNAVEREAFPNRETFYNGLSLSVIDALEAADIPALCALHKTARAASARLAELPDDAMSRRERGGAHEIDRALCEATAFGPALADPENAHLDIETPDELIWAALRFATNPRGVMWAFANDVPPYVEIKIREMGVSAPVGL